MVSYAPGTGTSSGATVWTIPLGVGAGSVGRPGGNRGDDDASHHGVSVSFPVGNARTHRDSPAAAGCASGTVARPTPTPTPTPAPTPSPTPTPSPHLARRNAQPDADAFALTWPDANAQPDANAFALTWPDAYAQAHSDAYAYAYAYANTNGNAHAFTRSVAEPDAHCYARAKSHTASDAGPHTGAHSYAHPDVVCPDADSTSAVVRAAQPGADLHRHCDPHCRADPNAAALRQIACNGALARRLPGAWPDQ